MNLRNCVPFLSLLLASYGCSALTAGSGVTDAGMSAEQETIYSIGWKLGHQLSDYHFTAAEADLIASGLRDALDGRAPRTPLTSEQRALVLQAQRMATAAAPERLASEAFVAAEAKRVRVEPTASGLVFEEVRPGSGAKPADSGTVTVVYESRDRHGALIATSGERADTFRLASPGTPSCVREALLRMNVGGKSRFVCPPQLAYGDRGHGSVLPGGSALVVEAELIAVDQPLPERGH